MLNSLRRVYLYLIASIALIITGNALSVFITTALRSAGLVRYTGDSVAPMEFNGALIFLIVALVIILPMGGLHYVFIRRDTRDDPIARRGVIRQVFLDILTIGYGSQVVINLAIAVSLLLSVNSIFNIGVADYLSSVFVDAVILGALLYERRSSQDLLPVAHGLSATLFYVQQIGFLIGSLIVTSVALSTIFVDSRFDKSSSASALVLIAGLVGFMMGTRDDRGSIFRQLADVAFLIAGTIISVVGLIAIINTILNLTIGQTGNTNDLIHNPGFGPLICGLGAIVFFLIRSYATPEQQRKQALQASVVGIALPLSGTFLGGLSALLTLIFFQLEGKNLPTTDLLIPLSIALGGVAWVALWPGLARMSDPRGNGPTVPRRVYVYLLLGTTVLGGTLALAAALYFTLTGATGTLDSGTAKDGTLGAFATVLVLGPTAGYYLSVLRRDQRTLKGLAPVQATTPASMTSDDVLRAVFSGQMTPEQASEKLNNLA